MRTKAECYDLVLKNRRLAADPQITKCSCRIPFAIGTANVKSASHYIGITTTMFPFACNP